MNNLQQSDRNYFWNERPRVIITELERYFNDVYDVTYVNDSAPSLEINERYYLFLPTSVQFNADTEEYNYYMIVDKEEYGTNAMTIECSTLDKAIDELIELFEK